MSLWQTCLRAAYHRRPQLAWTGDNWLITAVLLVALSLTFHTYASAQNSSLTWQRLSGSAVDLSISHGGHMWAVGTDGYAYLWNASRKTWARHGQRKDFARIDGDADGYAMAVTRTGGVFYTDARATGKTRWLATSASARDVGFGAGWVWIVGTDRVAGGFRVWRGRDYGGGDYNFEQVQGGMLRIDVDAKGNPWGVNERNDVFQFVGGNWRRHTGVKGTDIGIGGDGSVWVVGADMDDRLGGGTLHRRDPRSRRWIKDSRRLRTVTAGPGGQPAGVNTDSEIWDKSARAPSRPEKEPEEEPETETGGETVEKPEPEMRGRVVVKHAGDWFRFPGRARDMGLGSAGHIWVVGTDRFAYRWDAGKKSWDRIGKRQDFMHLDAAPDGGALAVTTNGDVYFAPPNAAQRTRWIKVGSNARDVGIGGNWAWITRRNGAVGQVLRAAYDGSGRFRWRRVAGRTPARFAHIDGDPNGNAWGVSDTNQVYRFDGGRWIEQPGEEATDIGIGADNTVWIIGTDIIDRLGGGSLYQFDARNGRWIKASRRLRTVTAGRLGNPAGTDHANEIWIRNYGEAARNEQTNLALKKKTSQSPQRRGRGRAARAVDGNTDGNFRNRSVTDIRAGNEPPWLAIDLGAVYRIDSLRVHNRTDCCSARLNGAVVEISNKPEWDAADITFSGTIKNARPFAEFTVGETGRYVRVRHTARRALNIAEVEVFGRPRAVPAVAKKPDVKKRTAQYPAGWTKLAGKALDMGLSGKGHVWVIGTDKFAYRWDAATKKWLRHGKRQDFVRIDAADDGSALAVSEKGGLFYSDGKNSKTAKWKRLAGKTRDVGIGDGWAWIVSTGKRKGGGAVARARYDKGGKFRWQRVAGGLVRIDGGKGGAAWGVDDKGDVYRRTRGAWRKQAGRKATDIGVGSDGSVWIVGSDVDSAAGGGKLYKLDARSGNWGTDGAHLRTVTVGPDGHPAGTNAANEIWLRRDRTKTGEQEVAGETTDEKDAKAVQTAHLDGMRALLPQSLKALALEGVKTEQGFTSGRVALNGNPAVIVIYTPEGKTKPNVVIWHAQFRFSDYMPDAGGTPLDSIGNLTSTSFWIVPTGNEDTKLPAAVVAHLNTMSAGKGKTFPHNLALKAGVNLVATYETAQMPGITQISGLFGKRPQDFYLRGTVDRSIFKTVKQTTVKPPTSSDPQAMAKLIKVYGETFLDNLILEGQKLPEFRTGPLTYTDVKYEVTGEAGAIQVGFELSLEMEVKPSEEGADDGGTVTFDALRLDYDQGEKTVTLSGDVDASATGKLVSYRGLSIDTLSFEGVKAEGEPLSATADGTGKLDSRVVDFEIGLEERNDKYEATLKLKGGWTLAELLKPVFKGKAPPGSDKIVLTDVQTSTSGDYLAGTVSLAGEDVQVSLLKPKDQSVMVAIEHRALELANYLPQLADTPVKKLGLGRSIFIVVGDLKNPNGSDLIGPTLEVSEADKDKLLPSYIVDRLDALKQEATGTIAGRSIYPLTLRANGTTILSLYRTSKGQVSAEGESQKVIDALGIGDDTYVLKGFVNKDMIRAARYAKKKLGSDKGGSLARRALPLLDGLDIGFPIPAFQPPKSGGWITFSKSRFRLKGIDGNLETFVSSGMSIKLPGAGDTALKAMDMVGKVKPVLLQSNLEVEFAATTQLTGAEMEETPFARLKALNDPDAEEAVSGLVPTTEPDQGWKPAFGVPFLTVNQVSVGGSFTDGGTTGDVAVNVGLQSVVEDRKPGQRLVLKGELVVNGNEIKSIDLEVPGEIKLAALPGINDVPGANALTVSDGKLALAFSGTRLSRYELAGQLSGRDAKFAGVLSAERDDANRTDYALYLAANGIKLGTFSEAFSRKLPSTFGDFPIQSGVMIGSNLETRQDIAVADLPERVQKMFEGIVADDAEITVAKGLSLFTKLEPETLPESNKFRKLFVSGFGFKEPLLFEGAIEDSGNSATPKVRLVATIPSYKVPGVSEEILEFTGSRMVLEDISGALTGSVEGAMTFKVKGQQFALEDGKVSASVDGNDKEVVVTGASTKAWEKAFGIPFLTLNRLELDVNVKTTDAGPNVDWGIKTKSVLNKNTADEQTFDANGKLEVVQNVVEDIVLELPGTVDIRKLPAIGKVPVINQLSYSDVKLSIYEIAANVQWTGSQTSVAGVLVRDKAKPEETEYTFYGAIQGTKISNIVGLFSAAASNAIPGTLEDFPVNSGVVVVSNQPGTTPRISELPERVQPLFTRYFPQEPDKQLKVVNGVSVYTTIERNNTNPDDPVWKLLFGSKGLNLTGPVTFEGSIIKDPGGKTKVRLAALIPTYKIPGIPESILKFDNSQVVFSNESGKALALQGEMTFVAEKTRKLKGSVTYEKSGGTEELKIEGRTREEWKSAFGIADLDLSNVAVQVVKKKGGGDASTGLSVSARAKFGGQSPTNTEQSPTPDNQPPPNAKGTLEIDGQGKLVSASFALLGTISMSHLPGLKKIPIVQEFSFTDVVLARNLVSNSSLIAAKTSWEQISPKKKLDAVFIDRNGTFALLLKTDRFKIGKLLETAPRNVPGAIAKISIPKSIVAISNQDYAAFNITDLPEHVRTTIFDDVIGKTTNQKIKITEGVTILTKLEPGDLPSEILGPMKTLFRIDLKGPVIAAGTVTGLFGKKKVGAALYLQIPDAVIPGGPVLEKLLGFRNVKFFIRAEESKVTQLGFGGDMNFKTPRFDNPGKFKTLKLEGEVYASLNTGEPLSLEVAGKMTDRWVHPMGLKDFTFENTNVKIGIKPDSVDVGFGSQAEFESKSEGRIYYALDLLVGIVPGTNVPKKLAVQFVAKKKDGDKLSPGASISHLTMVEMADSLFRTVLTGGASDRIIAQIKPQTAQDTARKLQGLLGKSSLVEVMQMDKIPLPLLAVLDPLVYFSTPGAGLPPRPGIPAPTLGLGVIVTGDLLFKLLGTTTNMAEADMRLTIIDGLRVKAKFPRRELGPVHAVGQLDVQAGLINLGSASFKMRGDAGIKDISALPLPGANASFELSIKQDGLKVKMDGTANIAGLERKFGMAVAPKSFDFHSPGACTTPFDISATANYSDFRSYRLSSLKPKSRPLTPKELAGCNPLDVARSVAEAGKKTGGGIGKKALEDAVKAAEGALEVSRGDFEGATESAKAAARLLTPANYVSGSQAFKDGVKRALQTWADAIKKVPGLGDALVDFVKVLGGPAKQVVDWSRTAVGAAGNFFKDVGKAFTSPFSRANDDPLKSALLSKIEKDPRYQAAPPSVRGEIYGATQALDRIAKQEEKDINDANFRRQELEKKRQAAIVKRKAMERQALKLVQLSRNASNCAHGEYWNIELGRCWLDGYALLRTSRWEGQSPGGQDIPKCMAVDQNGALWKDWCSSRDAAAAGSSLKQGSDVRFKLDEDGSIRTTGGQCLGIRKGAGKTAKNPQVLALACSGAETQKWRFDPNGRIIMEVAGLRDAQGNSAERLCITQLKKSERFPNAVDEALHLADCDAWNKDDLFDWTPVFGTKDFREKQPVKFPDTALFNADLSNLCLDGSGGYNAPLVLAACNKLNARQFFAFAFVDENYFTIASRGSHNCLDARNIVEGKSGLYVTLACHHGETQQFSLVSVDSGRVRIRNRKTGQCLAFPGSQTPVAGAGLAQTSCRFPFVARFRMTAVDDISKIPPPSAGPGALERMETLRADHLYKTFYIHPAGRPELRVKPHWASTIVLAGYKSSGLPQDPDKVDLAKFQIVPGLTGTPGTVSLKSIGRSGGLPIHETYLVTNPSSGAVIQKIEMSELYTQAATFRIVPGLNRAPGHISLQSVTRPMSYLWFNPDGGRIYPVTEANRAHIPGSDQDYFTAVSFVTVRQ